MLKAWIRAARPHTLPLAVSGILTGNMMAVDITDFSIHIFVWSLLTAIILQVLSNFANDYGDSQQGTDNEKRIGPIRSIQSGDISVKQMKRAILILVVAALISGLILLYVSMHRIGLVPTLVILAVGLLAIWSAYYYTASSNPYGYKGFGDLFVFIFFGLVAVYGPYYLQTADFSISEVLIAAGMGFFSTAVLNLNNIRDIDNDRESGKKTIVVRIGRKNALMYQSLLLGSGILLFVFYFILKLEADPWKFIFLVPAVFIIQNNIKTYQVKQEKDFYPLLKHLSMSVFLLAMSFSILWLI